MFSKRANYGVRIEPTSPGAVIGSFVSHWENHAVKRLFVEHPETVGESYFEHLQAASGFGSRMIICGCACLLHGIFPFLFERTGSKAVTELHDRMVTNRCRNGRDESKAGASEPSKSFENA